MNSHSISQTSLTLWSLPDENFAEQEELSHTHKRDNPSENVSFVYPGATTYALKNCKSNIYKREHVCHRRNKW